MTARILVVDDIPTNVRLLEAKLTAEYFEVITARNGEEALRLASQERPDIILLDVMMPGLDGFEVCRRLKLDPELTHIPVIMITALDQLSDRVQGLEAGADDFLTKPFHDLPLFARVRSLVRLKSLMDELRLREATGQRMGVLRPLKEDSQDVLAGGRILLVEDNPRMAERLRAPLTEAGARVEVEADPAAALARARQACHDLFIVSLDLRQEDGLRLCSLLRATEQARQVPVLTLVDEDDTERLVRGLEIGVNDYLMRPVERSELLARVRTQIRRRRYQERLRASLAMSLELAVTDPLTGLANRRYMETHLSHLLQQAEAEGRQVSVLMLDVDHFKAINDTHGHGVGDEVLEEIARRIRANLRAVDLPARYGGEEFVVVMPDTDRVGAKIIAERLCAAIAATPIAVSGTQERLTLTASLGVASAQAGEDSVASLLRRADEALYRAKEAGRNRVMLEAA